MVLTADDLHSQKIEAAWKHSGFKKSKKESCCEQSAVVLHQALHNGNKSECKHVER